MIKNKVKGLVSEIKYYSTSQKRKWQKVPYLCCLANGRTGWNDQLSRAAQQGYWALNAVSGYYRIYVDLETGRLVSPYQLDKDAADEDIILLAFTNDLNVDEIIKSLKEWANEPYGSYYSGKEINDREKRVQQDIKLYNLKPNSYKRKTSKKAIEKDNLVAGLID